MSRDSQLTADTPNAAPYFVEIAAARGELADPVVLEAELRRIGLRPVALTAPHEQSDHAECRIGWLIHFGALSAHLESVAVDPSKMGEAAAICWRVRPDGQSNEQGAVAGSRELFKLAVLLIDLAGGRRFYWSPADLWSDAAAFRAAVAEMLESGMPPILHLVAFVDNADQGTTNSCGLAHFCGQELTLEASTGLDRVARMRRLVRLAVDMMLNGPIAAARRFPGLAAGEFVEVALDGSTPAGAQLVHMRVVAP